jgi:hypothetical protein
MTPVTVAVKHMFLGWDECGLEEHSSEFSGIDVSFGGLVSITCFWCSDDRCFEFVYSKRACSGEDKWAVVEHYIYSIRLTRYLRIFGIAVSESVLKIMKLRGLVFD